MRKLKDAAGYFPKEMKATEKICGDFAPQSVAILFENYERVYAAVKDVALNSDLGLAGDDFFRKRLHYWIWPTRPITPAMRDLIERVFTWDPPFRQHCEEQDRKEELAARANLAPARISPVPQCGCSTSPTST